MRALRLRLLLLACAVLTIAGVLFACSQTPTSVPIRTFERAQRVDTICLRVRGPDAPEPLPPAGCAPVPPFGDGSVLENQLFALVTQTTRGEVAVVNLSASEVVDQNHAVPGLNFLPVGAIPTDVAATPDGRMAFVAAAEPNKFAIYGIPGHRIMGDRAPRRDPDGPTTLGSWPVCRLPQRPGALSVVPRGTLDDLAAYELVVVLPGDRVNPAKIVTIDPKPFLRATPRKNGAGDVLDDFGAGPSLPPGELVDCPVTSAIELAGGDAIPASFVPGARWDDGVKWVDGGIDLTCAAADRPASCGLRPCACPSRLAGPDGGAPLPVDGGAETCEPDAGGDADAGAPEEEVALDLGPLDAPQPVAIARDDQTLFIADDALPLVHVIDLSTPGAPVEREPFVVSSLADPTRAASIRDLAVSPPTREYRRFLYAVDRKDGTIAVFDVTNLATAERTPMRRPHPELNPFQPEDRIGFGAPVVAVAFARHDFPLKRVNGLGLPTAQSGLLCNPNPNVDLKADPNGDLGAAYRASSSDVDVGLVPTRLRGIFAFATLTTGEIVAIDVDDWDAPCRRPQDLSSSESGVAVNIGALSVPQPAPAPGDVDPYHAPIPAPESVSQEIFFPVSAPHRIRSTFLLRDDLTTGKHVPYLPSAPSITGTGAPLALFGQGSEATPRLRPTAARPGVSAGTEEVGVRFSIDTPDVHFDQEWTVTYEGKLPGFEGLPAAIATRDEYRTLTLSQPQARFCAKGVEDWVLGAERANAVTNALAASGRPGYSERLDRRMMDYVQITDELLPATDPYWSLPDLQGADACWEGELARSAAEDPRVPGRRHAACSSYFGTVQQQNATRDFPILEAYDDHVVVGRFATIAPNKTREAIYSDASNVPYMKLARCCFHNQAGFTVRGGAQWITVGTTLGFMSHLLPDATGRCVPSCDPREQLLNGRAPALPYGPGEFAPHRDTPLAMRNPAFSFFVQNGFTIDPESTGGGLTAVDSVPTRETFYAFQTRGQFSPLVIDLTSATGSTSVNPQSMRFIETLGQIAVVDGAAQGLVLIDLSLVSIARAPYY
ncbi:MAG: hypothetical protein KIT84_32865 [Labilithrix sp.]|nr:hypothetical protein [Labilithrix sp.]MCW5815868.1 hypothetical protein [Labilithrix sp.]